MIILKPGVSTDKGIQVGSSVSDVINSYGKVYKIIEEDVYKNEPNTGWYGPELYRGAYPNHVKYYLLCYQDEQSHTIRFIINDSSKKYLPLSTGGGEICMIVVPSLVHCIIVGVVGERWTIICSGIM